MTFPGGVSQPTIPGGAGQGLAWNMVLVQSVDVANNKAVVVDQLLKSFDLPLNGWRAKGLTPQPGEQWLIHKQFGKWFWAGLINGDAAGELGALIDQQKIASSWGDHFVIGGDLVSTCSRRDMTTAHPTVNNRFHCFRTFTRHDVTANLMKIGIGTPRVGGNMTIGIYFGPDPFNIPFFACQGAMGTSGPTVHVWNFDGDFVFPANNHIVFFVYVNASPSVMPTVYGPPSVPHSFLINRGYETNTSFYKDGILSIPPSIDMSDGWTGSPITCWTTLAVYD